MKLKEIEKRTTPPVRPKFSGPCHGVCVFMFVQFNVITGSSIVWREKNERKFIPIVIKNEGCNRRRK